MKLPNIESYSPTITNYYQITERKVNLGGYELFVSTKAPLTEIKQPDPIVDLFVTFINENPDMIPQEDMLILGSGNGLLASYLAKRIHSLNIWATDSTFTSLELTYHTAIANNQETICVFPDTNSVNSYFEKIDHEIYYTAIIIIPKGRKLARRWLFDAYRCLKDGGILYLAGANKEGVQSIAKDASDLFNTPKILGYKKGHRLYRLIKNRGSDDLPSWACEPGIFPSTWNEFNVSVNNEAYKIRTLPGVFAYDHIDEGTQMLLEWMHVQPGNQLLDIGCGCGIIGMHAARIGAKNVFLADNQIYSVMSTEENLRINNISNGSVYISDLFATLPNVKFDMILSNPPFHSGKNVEYQIAQTLITHGYHTLNKGGSLVIVANRFIRYDHIMNDIFGNIDIIKADTKYHLLSSHK